MSPKLDTNISDCVVCYARNGMALAVIDGVVASETETINREDIAGMLDDGAMIMEEMTVPATMLGFPGFQFLKSEREIAAHRDADELRDLVRAEPETFAATWDKRLGRAEA